MGILFRKGKNIDTLSSYEYRMAEIYDDNVMEYSRRRKRNES